MRYYELNPPIKLRAGFTGDKQDKPLYFDCCACGAKEPEIAGVLASENATADGRLAFDKIGVISGGERGPRHALYCAACFATIVNDGLTLPPDSPPDASAPGSQHHHQQQQNNSMPQATAPTAPKTKSTTVLFTHELDRKNAVRFQEVPVEGQAPVCGTLYLQKWFCGTARNVRLTVEVS
jgi:hypothetical protein